MVLLPADRVTMMHSLWRGLALSGLGLVVLAAAAQAGCAASTDDDGSEASTSTSSSSAGGAGGAGGAAAGGEGGSAGLCATDCSTIAAPECHRAVCNDGMYPGTIGQCVVVPDDSLPCDDELFCTVDDSCQSGTCVGGPFNDCGMDPPPCQEIVCDEDADSCGTQPLMNGTTCVDPNPCMLGSTCLNGTCGGGMLNDCFFAPVPDDCHVAVCNPINGMCEPQPGNEGDPCVDPNDLCTVNKTCAAGLCGGGTPKDCTQLTMGCDLGVCDTTTGQCTTQTVMNGQACDDLDACTTGETCNAGICGSGTPVTTCSQTGDGCCPSSCTALNDIDCACQTSSLSTPFNSNNGLDGSMFDVVALKNVEIQSVDVNISTGTKTIEIYYRPGSYVGHETSSAGWTLAGSATVTSLGQDVPTPVPAALSIVIPSGQTYGLYVTSTSGGMRYTNGTTAGSVAAQNQDMQILEGAGKSYPFGTSTFTPRVFNGVLHYEQCGN